MIQEMKSNGVTYIVKPSEAYVVVGNDSVTNYNGPVRVYLDPTVAQRFVQSQSFPGRYRVLSVALDKDVEELRREYGYYEVRFNDGGTVLEVDREMPTYMRSSRAIYARKVHGPSPTPIHYRIMEPGFLSSHARNVGQLILTVRAYSEENAVEVAKQKRRDYLALVESMAK